MSVAKTHNQTANANKIVKIPITFLLIRYLPWFEF